MKKKRERKGRMKRGNRENPPVRFSLFCHSCPQQREEKTVDHTQGPCSGCIRQMAGRGGGGGYGGGGGGGGGGGVGVFMLLIDRYSR